MPCQWVPSLRRNLLPRPVRGKGGSRLGLRQPGTPHVAKGMADNAGRAAAEVTAWPVTRFVFRGNLVHITSTVLTKLGWLFKIFFGCSGICWQFRGFCHLFSKYFFVQPCAFETLYPGLVIFAFPALRTKQSLPCKRLGLI